MGSTDQEAYAAFFYQDYDHCLEFVHQEQGQCASKFSWADARLGWGHTFARCCCK